MYIPEIHEVLGSSLSFRSMVELAYDGIKYVVIMLLVFLKSALWFVFNSVFPPKVEEELPQPASGLNSDV